ncbi:capsule assembly protein wzi [Lucifera butyrica]|uniref:Capsule assembly protein wzi n=1 Tax=Lucifera butyrica TaxID=1351585 RepID=A0A498RCX0_9FIRM|nr:capsule assembly Wzi family protein [Lucifera butyrica]VBB09394.1 capsule assembly protein wzi [Lucifera butyrica]
MKYKVFTKISIAIGLIIWSGPGLPASVLAADPPYLTYAQQVSANVPAGSYVYDDLEKLSGLGYTTNLPTGTKPYTRMQVAKWLQTILTDTSGATLPPYAASMLQELRKEFAPELNILNRQPAKNGVRLQEISLGENYYHGQTLPQQKTKSTYQPLNVYNNGYRYAPDFNTDLSFRLEGKIQDDTVLSLTPRVSYDDLESTQITLDSAYLTTHINNMAIQIGKDSLWWGQGEHGSLLLTNNAAPLTMIKLSNLEPHQIGGFFKFLGATNTTFIYSVLENHRSDVNYPSFAGLRMDFTPNPNFTFALAGTAIVGGQGRMLQSSDYWHLITGKNAASAGADKWDSIAGGDFRWRLPQFNDIQLYGEFYGEDQVPVLKVIPLPSDMGELLGIYIPRLSASGDWDAHFEWAHTRNTWYNHWAYTSGYTFQDNILGDAIGNNAYRYYGKFTHYSANGSQLAVNLERVSQQFTGNTPEIITSLWLSWRQKVDKDTYADLVLGAAKIQNSAFVAGNKDRDYLAGIRLTRYY